jgi:hypothetical protein
MRLWRRAKHVLYHRIAAARDFFIAKFWLTSFLGAHEIKNSMADIPPHPDWKELFEAWEKVASKHCAALGQVALNWAIFETIIDYWNLKLADISPQFGTCLTAQIAGSGRKLDAFIPIVKLLGIKKPSADTLEKFAKKAGCLAEQRNRAIHDPWDLSNPNTPKRLELTARKKLRRQLIPVSTDEMSNLAGDIATLKNEFVTIAKEAMNATREPSPHK